MRAPRLTATLLLLVVAGCLPSGRLNDGCHWVGDTTSAGAPGTRAHRVHLIEDVRIAQALGVRHGDSIHGHVNTPDGREARERCTIASMQEIMRRHGVTGAELSSLTGARILWVDLATLYLPVITIFGWGAAALAQRVLIRFAEEENAIAIGILTIAAPVVAAFGVAFIQMWAWNIESILVRDGHISYRVFQLPVTRHGWIVWFSGMAVFSLAAAREFRRRGCLTRGHRSLSPLSIAPRVRA